MEEPKLYTKSDQLRSELNTELQKSLRLLAASDRGALQEVGRLELLDRISVISKQLNTVKPTRPAIPDLSQLSLGSCSPAGIPEDPNRINPYRGEHSTDPLAKFPKPIRELSRKAFRASNTFVCETPAKHLANPLAFIAGSAVGVNAGPVGAVAVASLAEEEMAKSIQHSCEEEESSKGTGVSSGISSVVEAGVKGPGVAVAILKDGVGGAVKEFSRQVVAKEAISIGEVARAAGVGAVSGRVGEASGKIQKLFGKKVANSLGDVLGTTTKVSVTESVKMTLAKNEE